MCLTNTKRGLKTPNRWGTWTYASIPSIAPCMASQSALPPFGFLKDQLRFSQPVLFPQRAIFYTPARPTMSQNSNTRIHKTVNGKTSGTSFTGQALQLEDVLWMKSGQRITDKDLSKWPRTRNGANIHIFENVMAFLAWSNNHSSAVDYTTWPLPEYSSVIGNAAMISIHNLG